MPIWTIRERAGGAGHSLPQLHRLKRAGVFLPAVGRTLPDSGTVTAKIRLEADRTELARFVDATFRYADEGTVSVLRTFAEGSNEVLASVQCSEHPRP